MLINFQLNGDPIEIDAPPQTPLSQLLRDRLKLKSVRSSCQKGMCGTCLVMLNRKSVYSCLITAIQIREKEIITVEGLLKSPEWEMVETGFKKAKIHLCPYCAPARALSFIAMLWNYPFPNDNVLDETLFSVNCTCASYHGLKESLLFAIEAREENRRG